MQLIAIIISSLAAVAHAQQDPTQLLKDLCRSQPSSISCELYMRSCITDSDNDKNKDGIDDSDPQWYVCNHALAFSLSAHLTHVK
jgi:hypothetical protein